MPSSSPPSHLLLSDDLSVQAAGLGSFVKRLTLFIFLSLSTDLAVLPHYTSTKPGQNDNAKKK